MTPEEVAAKTLGDRARFSPADVLNEDEVRAAVALAVALLSALFIGLIGALLVGYTLLVAWRGVSASVEPSRCGLPGALLSGKLNMAGREEEQQPRREQRGDIGIGDRGQGVLESRPQCGPQAAPRPVRRPSPVAPRPAAAPAPRRARAP